MTLNLINGSDDVSDSEDRLILDVTGTLKQLDRQVKARCLFESCNYSMIRSAHPIGAAPFDLAIWRSVATGMVVISRRVLTLRDNA